MTKGSDSASEIPKGCRDEDQKLPAKNNGWRSTMNGADLSPCRSPKPGAGRNLSEDALINPPSSVQ